MKWTILIFSIALLLLGNQCSSSRVLGVFPFYTKSHWSVGSSVLKVLAEAGHEVTVVAPYIMQNSSTATYKNLHLREVVEVFEKFASEIKSNSWLMKLPLRNLLQVIAIGPMIVPAVMENRAVKELLTDKTNQFDLILVGPFSIDALYGFGEHFNAPVISVFSAVPMRLVNVAVGNPDDPSYNPSAFLPYTTQMTLAQRVTNYLVKFLEFVLIEKVALTAQSKMYEKYFPNNKKPLREVMKEDVALAFVNTHFSLSFPAPIVPNMIEIGGVNIDRKVGELPAEFKNFLDSAKEGVVLFSMGSFLQASDLTEEQRKVIISAFGKLKQKVIWRYNLPDADQLPKNILTSEWLPQKEILSHPNVKVFITHGGMLGTTESLYHGKPMIGIPVFGDQPLNIARAVSRGYALKLDRETLSEEAILTAIHEILGNPSYTQRVEQLSRIYRDQPMTPQERVLYWCEYVLRHNGAKHMQVESQNLSLIASLGLDVFAILTLIVLLFVVLPNYLIVKCLVKKFRGGSTKQLKKK